MQAQAPSVHLAHSQKPVTPRDRLIRIGEVEHLTGLKKSTLYRLIQESKFPPPLRLTAKASAWNETAILQWVQERIKEGGAA